MRAGRSKTNYHSTCRYVSAHGHVLSFVTKETCDQDWTYFTGHTKNVSVKIVH